MKTITVNKLSHESNPFYLKIYCALMNTLMARSTLCQTYLMSTRSNTESWVISLFFEIMRQLNIPNFYFVSLYNVS